MSDSDSWCILTTRLGKDVREPTDADLKDALVEVLSTADVEHPNAWLSLGLGDGTMYVLDVCGAGTIMFNQWADADFEEELAPPTKLADVSIEDAQRLWRSLLRRDVEAVRCEAWQPVMSDAK